MAKGYAAPIWMTYRQTQELKGQVRKVEHGALVVYANILTKTETNEQGEDTEREIRFMKGHTVFNVEQVDGLPAHYYAQPENLLPLSERIENRPLHHQYGPLQDRDRSDRVGYCNRRMNTSVPKLIELHHGNKPWHA